MVLCASSVAERRQQPRDIRCQILPINLDVSADAHHRLPRRQGTPLKGRLLDTDVDDTNKGHMNAPRVACDRQADGVSAWALPSVSPACRPTRSASGGTFVKCYQAKDVLRCAASRVIAQATSDAAEAATSRFLMMRHRRHAARTEAPLIQRRHYFDAASSFDAVNGITFGDKEALRGSAKARGESADEGVDAHEP